MPEPITPPAGDPNIPPAGTPPAGTPPAGNPPAPAAPEFKIPEAYAKEGWTEKVKSVDDLWKINSHAQSLLGRQGIKLPAENATEQEKLAWQRDVLTKHLGLPADEKGYQFAEVPGITRTPDQDAWARKIFHEAGIPASAAASLVKAYEEREAAAAQAADVEFNQLANTLWKDMAPAVVQKLGGLLAQELPDALQGHIAQLPSSALLALGVMVDAVKQKYDKGSSFVAQVGKVAFNPGVAGVGDTLEQLTATQRTLMTDPDFRNPNSPRYNELQATNTEIRKRMTALFEQKRA